MSSVSQSLGDAHALIVILRDMRILVAEDDTVLAETLKINLEEQAFAVDVVHTGAEGFRYACRNEYDLIVLDFHLPDTTGALLIRRLHEQPHPPPILMLTVIADPHSKAQVLNAGADDFLVKPFVLEELLARIRALLRRSRHVIPTVLSVSDIELDTSARVVRRRGAMVFLTPKEFAVLEYLLRNRGQVVSRTTLLEHAWDASGETLSSSLDTHMMNLRRKLGNPEVIETIHSRGFLIS